MDREGLLDPPGDAILIAGVTFLVRNSAAPGSSGPGAVPLLLRSYSKQRGACGCDRESIHARGGRHRRRRESSLDCSVGRPVESLAAIAHARRRRHARSRKGFE